MCPIHNGYGSGSTLSGFATSPWFNITYIYRKKYSVETSSDPDPDFITIWVNFSRIRIMVATESFYLSLPGVRTDGFIILILGDFVTYTTVTVQEWGSGFNYSRKIRIRPQITRTDPDTASMINKSKIEKYISWIRIRSLCTTNNDGSFSFRTVITLTIFFVIKKIISLNN